MQKHAEITWAEMFRQWQQYRERFPQLFGDFPVTRVFIPCPPMDELLFWGYDWIKPEQYEERIKYVTENPRAFLHLGDVLNKGTLHTLHMLAEKKATRSAPRFGSARFCMMFLILELYIATQAVSLISYILYHMDFFEVNITYGIMP